MTEPYDVEEIEEKVILVGVSEQDGDDAEDSLAELAELVHTAGASVVGTLIQKRESIHPLTYVGTGKVEEIDRILTSTGATGIVCDDEQLIVSSLEGSLAVSNEASKAGQAFKNIAFRILGENIPIMNIENKKPGFFEKLRILFGKQK